MRILVVGDGKVGHTLAEHLTREGHDITMVDQNDEVLQKCEDTLDVLGVRGNGANAKTLMDAEVGRMDVIIAVTASDEINMLCCLLAKRLGAKYSIARIRDPEYNESLTLLQREIGLDMAINPERATALEISHLLRFPFASNIESFAKGQVEMVGFRAQAQDAVVGWPLKSLSSRHPMMPRVLYVAVERENRVIIPNGDFIIEAGDRVHVMAERVTITEYFRFLGKNARRIRNVMLLGGGRISYYLAKDLNAMGIRVKMMEINQAKAARLSEMLPHVDVIHGDGTDQELLEQEGLADMDAFIALCDRDEENLMTGLFASQQGVKKVIVKNNRVSYADILTTMGLDSVVSPKEITCNNILRYTRARANRTGGVEKLYRLMDGKAEALELVAKRGDAYIGVALKNLHVRKGTLVGLIVRKGKVIVPFGNDFIGEGDHVIILSNASGISELKEVFER
ncbi:MAG: Trk system potassium transporter TrkA [Aristaeellaceae bacterium]